MNALKRWVAVASLVIGAMGAFAQATDYKQIQTPALRKFSIPQPKRVQLANGMVIFLQEDHELPLIKGSATIRGGSRDVPANKSGLLSIYTGAWRTGGTTKIKGDDLDELLDARAARVETGGGVDTTSVSMDVLKGDFDTVFPIFVDVLRNPAFPEDKIELAKTQARTGISRRNDEPGGILAREANKLGYGAGSPYARQPEYATINAITRDDLVAFHAKTVHPNNIILAFIGDFDAAKVEKKLRDTFASWPRGTQIAKPDAGMQPAKAGVYFISKDDVTQANIAMVHPGIERNNPDYAAVQVMNEIFSGGFSGRLMQSLRTQRGLTYGVGGGIGAPWDYPGLFRVQMATKSETTLEAIDALRNEVARMSSDPVTAAELSLAKESILNAFVFTMDTREKALQQQVLLELYGFPSDYFTKYPGLIEKVTAEDVQRVAKKYIHPSDLAVLVVGNEKNFEKPLSSAGTITPIDITIPEADAGAKKAAPASGNAEGMALINKVMEFVGGKAAIDKVNAVQRTGTMSMHTPQGDMQAETTSITRYPASQRVVMKLPMGEMTRVVTPEAAWMITPMGSQDLPGSQREQSLSDMKTELLNVLRNVGNAKYTFSGSGNVVEINADGANVKWEIDPATGRVIRTTTRAGGPMPGDVVTEYTAWKKFGDLNLPSASVVTRNGEKVAELTLSEVVVNPAIDEKAFVK